MITFVFLLRTFPAQCLRQALLRLWNSPDYIQIHLLLVNFLANVFSFADGGNFNYEMKCVLYKHWDL